MKLDLNKKILEFLTKNPETKFTAREISQWVFKTYPQECAFKRERSKATVLSLKDDNALIQQLVAEIGARRKNIQRNNSHFKFTEDRPRKYYFTNQTDQEAITKAESKDIKSKIEQDLYPMLSRFLLNEYGIYSKRINDKYSSNSQGPNGNKWLYPDLVGMEDLTVSWGPKIKDCAKQYAAKKTRLWSFEVKLLINRSNVRQAFFQAVSNSSWANYGYLVAAELEGSDTKRELEILSSLHGIGFILLDSLTPVESQILIPAKERIEIDWDTANRLIEENRDFVGFIEEVISFYQRGNTKLSDWDTIEVNCLA